LGHGFPHLRELGGRHGPFRSSKKSHNLDCLIFSPFVRHIPPTQKKKMIEDAVSKCRKHTHYFLSLYAMFFLRPPFPLPFIPLDNSVGFHGQINRRTHFDPGIYRFTLFEADSADPPLGSVRIGLSISSFKNHYFIFGHTHSSSSTSTTCTNL